ncbi:MAG: hypothetical protein GXP42_03795 [Chloroflexi bacterium]|nr:hypothetical protein [Chloroflexota bacterium]
MFPNVISHPLSLGELLDVTFRIYRRRFWRLVLTAGGLVIPIQIVSHALNWANMGYGQSREFVPFVEGGVNPSAPIWLIWLQVGVGFLALFLVTLSNIAVTWQVNRILFGDAPSARESWRKGLSYFLRYIAIILLAALAFIIFIPILALGALIPCIVIIIALALPIVVFYFVVRLFLTPTALIVDNLGPIEAIKTTWRNSSGYFWRLAGYTLLLWILGFAFYFAPFFLIQAPLSSISMEDMPLIISLFGIITSVLNVLWTPIYATALVVLYHDLKLRNQPDAHIEEQLQALEAASQIVESVDEEDVSEAVLESADMPPSHQDAAIAEGKKKTSSSDVED